MDKIWKKVVNLAEKAYKKDEVPIGCVVVYKNEIVGTGYNQKKRKNVCTAHAEIIAIEKAGKKLKDWRLEDCQLYVSLKPCDMCMEVIRQARIKEVFYLIDSHFDNEKRKNIKYLKTENEYTNKCLAILKNFFKNKR